MIVAYFKASSRRKPRQNE